MHLAGLSGEGGDAGFKLNTAVKSAPGVQNEAEPSTSVGSGGREREPGSLLRGVKSWPLTQLRCRAPGIRSTRQNPHKHVTNQREMGVLRRQCYGRRPIVAGLWGPTTITPPQRTRAPAPGTGRGPAAETAQGQAQPHCACWAGAGCGQQGLPQGG